MIIVTIITSFFIVSTFIAVAVCATVINQRSDKKPETEMLSLKDQYVYGHIDLDEFEARVPIAPLEREID